MLIFFGMDLQDIIVFIILVCVLYPTHQKSDTVQMLVSVGQCSIAMHKETFKCPNAASVFGHTTFMHF